MSFGSQSRRQFRQTRYDHFVLHEFKYQQTFVYRDHCMLDFVSGPVRLLEMANGRLCDVIHLVSFTERCLPEIFKNIQVSPILKQTYLKKQRIKQPHKHIPVAQLISFWEEKGGRWHCFLSLLEGKLLPKIHVSTLSCYFFLL